MFKLQPITALFNVKLIKVKLSLCLTKRRAIKTYWRSTGIAPRIINLGSRWRLVVSFTPQPLYLTERSPVTTG